MDWHEAKSQYLCGIYTVGSSECMFVLKGDVIHFHVRQCSEKRMGGGEGKALNLCAGLKQFPV